LFQCPPGTWVCLRGECLPSFADTALTRLLQNVWWTPKIRNHDSPKPSRSQVALRSVHPTRPLPTSKLMFITAPTMVGSGASFTAGLWRLNVVVSLGELGIDLKEGMWRNKPQAAHFRFICDQHTQEVRKRPCFCLIDGRW